MANLMKLPAFGKGRAVQYDPLDEESYGELPAMGEPTAPPSSLGEPNAPSWKTSDELRETIRNRPKLERATGWKGVLQTIGDAVVNPELMHPKYTHQVREYGQKVEELSALKKLEDQDAENERRRAVAEAQINSNAARTETAKKQGALYEGQLAKLSAPDADKYINVGNGQVFNASKGEYIPNPNAPKSTKESPSEARVRRTQEADDQGLRGRDRQEYILTGRMPRLQAAGGGGREPDHTSAFRMIEAAKAKALRDAEDDAKKEVLELKQNYRFMTNGEPDLSKLRPAEEAVYAALEKKKQQIQNDYEGQVSAVGGNPSHFEYPAQAPSPAPKPAARPQQAQAPAQQAAPAKPVRILNPKTGETRSFDSLTPDAIADAKRQGFQVLD